MVDQNPCLIPAPPIKPDSSPLTIFIAIKNSMDPSSEAVPQSYYSIYGEELKQKLQTYV